MNLKGFLFDSGDTLVFPRGGSWWPGPDFQTILRRHGISDAGISPERMRIALDEAEKYLGVNHSIADCDEEREQFRNYYRIISRNLGFSGIEAGMIDDLASAYVDGCNLELYSDTVDALERLTRGGMTLGVLSDAWPSLERKYATLGIRQYFKSFTISAEVGCCKPCDEIYLRAIDDIGIDAQDLLFVDDDLENVRAAIRLGMKGAVILRDKQTVAGDTPFIRDLRGISEIMS